MASVGLQALLPPPATWSKFAKVLWYLADTVVQGAAWRAFEHAAAINPQPSSGGTTPATEWRRWVVHASNTATTDTTDDQQFSVDIAIYSGGTLGTPWDDAHHSQAEVYLATFANQLASFIPPYLTLVNAKAYAMSFNPYDYAPDPERPNYKPPFAIAGAPVWQTTTWNYVGVNTGNQAAQVCSTITELTPSRPNWGRLYTPTLASSSLQPTGRWVTGTVDGLANLYNELDDNLGANGMVIVIPMTMSHKVPLRALQQITGIRVDDIPDVHRTRRYNSPIYTKTIDT